MLDIQFSEIPDEGLTVNVVDHSWFPALELTRKGDILAEVFLQRNGARVLCRGTLKVSLIHPCDRCLDEYVRPYNLNFQLVLEVGTEADEQEFDAGDYIGVDNDIDVVLLEQPLIDIAWLLYQQLILALPLKFLCSPDCPGLCDNCGANLNQGSCSCSGKSENSPFAALARLIENKK